MVCTDIGIAYPLSRHPLSANKSLRFYVLAAIKTTSLTGGLLRPYKGLSLVVAL